MRGTLELSGPTSAGSHNGRLVQWALHVSLMAQSGEVFSAVKSKLKSFGI